LTRESFPNQTTFPDVPDGLERVQNTAALIFSRETDAMASTTLLNPYSHVFKHIATVGEIMRHKPVCRRYTKYSHGRLRRKRNGEDLASERKRGCGGADCGYVGCLVGSRESSFG
jgi:hypothetical protein